MAACHAKFRPGWCLRFASWAQQFKGIAAFDAKPGLVGIFRLAFRTFHLLGNRIAAMPGISQQKEKKG
jgi:hypothetical protein